MCVTFFLRERANWCDPARHRPTLAVFTALTKKRGKSDNSAWKYAPKRWCALFPPVCVCHQPWDTGLCLVNEVAGLVCNCNLTGTALQMHFKINSFKRVACVAEKAVSRRSNCKLAKFWLLFGTWKKSSMDCQFPSDDWFRNEWVCFNCTIHLYLSALNALVRNGSGSTNAIQPTRTRSKS